MRIYRVKEERADTWDRDFVTEEEVAEKAEATGTPLGELTQQLEIVVDDALSMAELSTIYKSWLIKNGLHDADSLELWEWKYKRPYMPFDYRGDCPASGGDIIQEGLMITYMSLEHADHPRRRFPVFNWSDYTRGVGKNTYPDTDDVDFDQYETIGYSV